MVAHPAPPGQRQLRGANVHAPIQLHRVGVDHLATQTAGQLDREVGLTSGARANHRDRPGTHDEATSGTRIGGCGTTATRTITAAG
jgi:hypothetical protein